MEFAIAQRSEAVGRVFSNQKSPLHVNAKLNWDLEHSAASDGGGGEGAIEEGLSPLT